jgi:GNAT superfamily N-acetyltransferase
MSNSNPSVRPANDDDLDVLMELNVGLFTEDAHVRDPFVNPRWSGRRDYFVELIADGDRNVAWVANANGETVGYLVGRLQDANDFRSTTTAVLESMYVRAGQRNAGVGASLVRTFLEWARSRHAGRASVNAYTENAGAIRFYRRFGFRPKATTFDMSI